MKSFPVVPFILFGLVVLLPRTLDAHEKGTIVLNTSAIAPGGALVVTGSKLGRNASVRLELRGALSTFSFGRFYADTAGRLKQQLTIPVDVHPGQYTIAAVAADGDVSAQVDLVVTPTASAAATQPGMHDMPGMGVMGEPHATAERMNIPISTTAAGRAVIWIVVFLSALAGLLLLRGTRPRDI
jgi:hypothetical protein